MLTYGLQVSFLPIYADRHGMNPGLFFLVFALVMALVRRPAWVSGPIAADGRRSPRRDWWSPR